MKLPLIGRTSSDAWSCWPTASGISRCRRPGFPLRLMSPQPMQPTLSVTESLREIARRGARDVERHALSEVLERVSWNRAEAARILKVSYKTLLNKIAECGLTPPSRDDTRRTAIQ